MPCSGAPARNRRHRQVRRSPAASPSPASWKATSTRNASCMNRPRASTTSSCRPAAESANRPRRVRWRRRVGARPGSPEHERSGISPTAAAAGSSAVGPGIEDLETFERLEVPDVACHDGHLMDERGGADARHDMALGSGRGATQHGGPSPRPRPARGRRRQQRRSRRARNEAARLDRGRSAP